MDGSKGIMSSNQTQEFQKLLNNILQKEQLAVKEKMRLIHEINLQMDKVDITTNYRRN